MLKKFTQILSDDNRIYSKEKFKSSPGEPPVPELISRINYAFDKLSREKITRYLIDNIRDSLDLDQVLQITVEKIGKLFKADRCIIALYNKTEFNFELKIEYKSSEDISSVLSNYAVENMSQKWLTDLVFNKIPVAVNNARSSLLNEAQVNYFNQNRIKSLIAVPLIYKGKIQGLIIVQYVKSEHNWQADQVDFLKDISNQIAIAINQAELYSDAKSKLNNLNLLWKITETIRNTLDINEIKNKFVNIVGESFSADRCFIAQFDYENRCFLPIEEFAEYRSSNEVKSSVGYDFREEMQGYFADNHKHTSPTLMLDMDKFIAETDPNNAGLKALANNFNVKTNFGSSILVEGKVYGAFVLHYTRKTVQLTDEDIEILKIIANQVGIALQQAELHLQAKKQADREALLRKITETIRNSLDINEIKASLVNEVGKMFKGDKCFFWEYDNKKKEFYSEIKFNYVSDMEFKKPYTYNNETNSFLANLYKKSGYILIPDFSKFANNSDHIGEMARHQIQYHCIKSNYSFGLFEGNWFLGAFALQYKEPTYLSNEDIELLRIIVNQAAIALKQARLYAITKKQAEKLAEQADKEALLRKIIETIRNTLDINEIKRIMVNEIGIKFNADKCFFWDYDNNNKEFIEEIEFKYVISSELGKPYTYGKEINEFVMESYKKTGCFFIPDFLKYINESGYIGEIARHQIEYHDIRSNYCFGLFEKEEFLGAFALQYKKPTYLGDEDVELLRTVVNQAAIALKQANLYSTTKKQAENLNKLAKREALVSGITRSIRSSLDPDEIEKKLVNEVGATFNADKCFIRPIDQDKMIFLPVVVEYRSSSDVKSIIGFGEKEDKYLIQEYKKGHGFRISDIGASKYLEDNSIPKSVALKLINARIISNYSYPMFYKGELIGAFVLQYSKITYLSDGNIRLLETIVNQASIALGQAILYKKTQKLAESEALLRKIAQTMINSSDYDEIKINMVNEVGRAFIADRCFIRLFENNNEFDPVITEYLASDNFKSIKGYSLSDGFNLFIRSYLFKNPMILPNIDLAISNQELDDSYKEFVQYFDVKSNYAIPILDNEDLMGVFVLHYVREKKYLSNSEIELLQTIAFSAGVVLKQAKLYNKAQQATRAKSEFLANMSHEFRTPLNAIIGFTDMIINGDYGKLTDKGYKYLENISNSGKHLLNLVNDLLDISKIEAGKTDLNYQNLDSRDIIQETVLCLESLAKGKDITVDMDLQHINVEADPVRFKQIVYNLLNNAIKFTPNGGKVKIMTSLDGSNLVTAVEDNGIGIARKDHKKIFEQFRQIDSSYSRVQEGTGLGLALTKKLVELHGGSIYFESKKGKGSKFWFVLHKAEMQNLEEV